ncbi:restriction endonuclease subunit S [Planococcus faecalis]|uniref:Type I restriction modification DNA specificity domain-containing protein n=1 Tax=Planococcus faecalis TaxID=1598147 RepID=A0ABM6IPA7_9BACL|nr:restriction endonuclease subunit S [Planococcus faecalis]AQU78422.1 hypothetical protein AJGP001_03520 [Planococcus faecalis]OHX52385.1 hypothetical protein BB777_12095 [Planococcus faecalis]
MNVPQLRFSGFDGEWNKFILEDIAIVKDGTHDSPKYYSTGYPLVTSKNLMKNGDLDLENVSLISEKDFMEINKRSKVDVGDILFGMIGTLGNPVRVQSSDFAIKNVALIKESKVSNEYILHYLGSKSIEKQFHLNQAGGTQKFIGLGLIRDLKIYLPSEKELQKVASFLTLLDRKINKQQEKIEKLEQFKKGMMQKIFSQELRFRDEGGGKFGEWYIKTLGELGEFKRSYSFSRNNEGEGEYCHIHYGDIHTKLNSIVDQKTELPNISVKGVLEEIETGDVLFADASEDYKDLGKSIVITDNQNRKIVAGLHTHRFKPSALINSVFLMYFTKTESYTTFIRKYGTGVSVLGISKTNLRIIDVPVPSVKEQEKIADYLLSMEKKIKKEKEKLLALEEQKKGFMQGMFI